MYTEENVTPATALWVRDAVTFLFKKTHLRNFYKEAGHVIWLVYFMYITDSSDSANFTSIFLLCQMQRISQVDWWDQQARTYSFSLKHSPHHRKLKVLIFFFLILLLYHEFCKGQRQCERNQLRNTWLFI